MNLLIIIFHHKDYAEMHTLLQLNDFGQDQKKKCICINAEAKAKYFNQIINNPDIVILDDSGIPKEVEEYLKSLLSGEREIHLAYHATTRERCEKKINEIIQDLPNKPKLLPPIEFHHEFSDTFYKTFIEFEKGLLSQTGFDYESGIKKILEHFQYDKVLEAKLELLHALLVPPSDCQQFEGNNGLLNKLIVLLENGVEKKNLISAWNTFKQGINGKNLDQFGPEYIQLLSTLRDALLEDYECT